MALVLPVSAQNPSSHGPAAAAVRPGQPSDPGLSVSAEPGGARAGRVARRLPLKIGGRLTLDNSRGDVVIQSWDRPMVEIVAEPSGESEEAMAQVPVTIQAVEDQIDVTSRFPAYAPNLRVRVDYRLRVPGEIDLKMIRTGKGRIEVSGVSGRAVLKVENGGIRVTDFRGTLDATTALGGIDAALTEVTRDDVLNLETFNGDIVLRVPRGLKAHFALRTLNGKVESDVPFEVRSVFGPPSVHEPGGVEAPLVRLTSVNGDIRIVH